MSSGANMTLSDDSAKAVLTLLMLANGDGSRPVFVRLLNSNAQSAQHSDAMLRGWDRAAAELIAQAPNRAELEGIAAAQSPRMAARIRALIALEGLADGGPTPYDAG